MFSCSIANCNDMFGTGMELDSFEVDGLTDQLILLNAPFKQGRATFTTSPLLAKEEHSGGMLTYRGYDQLSMVPSSFFPSVAFLTHLPSLTRKFPLSLVVEACLFRLFGQLVVKIF